MYSTAWHEIMAVVTLSSSWRVLTGSLLLQASPPDKYSIASEVELQAAAEPCLLRLGSLQAGTSDGSHHALLQLSLITSFECRSGAGCTWYAMLGTAKSAWWKALLSLT